MCAGQVCQYNAHMKRREFLSTSAGALFAGAASNFAATNSSAKTLSTEISNARATRSSNFLDSRAQDKAQHVIIDTDPGVDDAMAIFLALRSPELKVEAITPVAGNVPLELTLPNALRLVEIAGRRDIPVAAGASAPLVRRLVTARYAHGENGLGGVDFPAPSLKPVSESAVEMIRRIVRSSPGEITVVALGPLTNVATALKADPELAKMIRAIVLMGGSLSGGNITPAAEFNFYVDPEAARIVFDAGVPITMVGLDVTRHTALTDEHFKTLSASQNPVSQAAAKIARNAIDHTRAQGFLIGPNMHDSLALAAFLDPTLLKWKNWCETKIRI